MDTKNIIMAAALELYRKKSVNAVTVQQIIDLAKVSRATFYKYFLDKYDVITIYCEDSTSRILQEYAGRRWSEIFLAQNQFVYENLPLFSAMFQKDETSSLARFMAKNNYEQILNAYMKGSGADAPSSDISVALYFTIHGLEQIIRQWVLHGAPSSAEHFSQTAFDLIPEVLRQYL